ncbi:MAG: cytochrome c biogenesis protein ResB, partial [Anaerolineae bacterium]|nr:cytochrome c biogenesis protein ResB [Anaerolineae bacterium]
ALLAFNLCLSLINLAESLWQSRRSVAVRRPESFFAEGLSTFSLTTARGWEEVLESVRRTLKAVLTRPREEFAQGAAYFHADTGLWSYAGALALHVGVLLLLLGGLIGGRWGWQTESLRLGPGRQGDIRETGYTLRLDDLVVKGGDFRAEVALLRESAVVSRGVVSERRPLRYSGLTVRGMGYGPAAVVRAWDETGRPLTLQSFAEGAEPAEEAYLPFEALGEEHYFAVPESNLVVRLVLVEDERADVGPSFEMQAYRRNSADPVFEGTLSSGHEVVINGHRYSVEVQYYALLLVRHDPGSGFVLLGLLLAAGGLLVTLWKPRAQAWVLVADEGGEVIIRGRGETRAQDRRFARLVTELTEHLTEQGLMDGRHG